MADLIELNISVKDQSVKQAVTTVSRLEREIIKAVKAVDSHQISQKRFDQILAKSKQEYKAYAGNAGLATININKFVKAQRQANQELQKAAPVLGRVSQSVDRVAQSSVRYAAAARSAGDATNRTRQAFLNTANSIAILDGPLGGVASRFSAFGVLIGRTGLLLGVALAGFSALGVVAAKAIRSFMDFEVQTAKINAILRTTGSQAGLTADEIESMASRIALSTLESEEAIRSAATQLLTFKNVGKDVFETTLKAATDMAALGFGTVESEAVKLAKALEDPRQSLTSLSRSGITFTRQQRQLITSLVESGRQAEAMDRILANVNRQVGGAGEAAARTTMAGAFDTIGQATGRAVREFGQFILQASGLDDAIKRLASGLEDYAGGPSEMTAARQVELAREQLQLIENARTAEGQIAQERLQYLQDALSIDSEGKATAQELASLAAVRADYEQEIRQLQEDYGDDALSTAQNLLSLAEDRLRIEEQSKAATRAQNELLSRSNAIDNLLAQADALRENIGLTETQIRLNSMLAAEGFLNVDISEAIRDYRDNLVAAGADQFVLTQAVEEFTLKLLEGEAAAKELAEALDLAELGRQFVNNSRSIEDQNDLLVSQLALMDDGISASEARRQAELNFQLEQANTLRLAKEITEQDYEQLRLAILKNRELSADLAGRTAAPARAGRGGGRSFADEFEQMRRSLDSAYAAQRSLTEGTDKLNEALSKGLVTQREHSSLMQLLREKYDEVTITAKRLAEELQGPIVSAIGSVSDAFGDFMSRGLSDFKGFVQQIIGSFQSMISQMIAMAVKNRIMLSLGVGGITPAAAQAGQVAGLGSAGGMLGSLGTGAGVAGIAGGTGLLGGAGSAVAGLGGGGAGFFNIAGNAAMAGGGAMATIGAAIPVIGAVALAIGFLRTKTKELDSGLNVTVKNMDALVESFRTVEKSRFFGLSKRTSTSSGGVSNAVSDPIVAAVEQIQQSVLTAAEAFGFGADAFDSFSYQFKLSLKGLSEEQQLQKINEELLKMGDSFASLTGHFSSMNELLEAAEQRYQIENRMLEALGRSSEVLARNRERELAATHALNRGLLQATFNLEDANAAVSSAMDGLRRAIDAEKDRLRSTFDGIVEAIRNSFELVIKDLRDKLSLANEAVNRSRSIFNQLESALSGRSVTSDIGQTFARREGALSFIRGGDFSDEKKLEEALGVVSEPTEGLFSSFIEYARDFARTSLTLEEAKNVAKVQLTADEQQVLLLEQQIVDADRNLEQQLANADSNLEQQLAALDQQYQVEVDQLNALLGIDTSVKSVGDAIATLRGAIEALASAQAAAKAAQTSGGGFGGGSIDQFSTGKKYQGFDLLDVGGAAGLLQAAGLTGVSTSGKTGLQIAQDIANTTGQAVQLDAASRVQQFARGGMFDGGMRLVGEEGPELEVTGPSRIYSKQQTKELLRGDSNESEGLRTEVSELRQELRQLLIANNKYTKRSYDLYNKWDIDGLPAERT